MFMSNRGFLGVDMFFVISGFLIVSLLLRERDRHGTISLRKFYARRTLRIFPVYYAMLAALAAAYYLKPDAGSASSFHAELPYYITYTSNWIAAGALPFTWSLAAEEQFYILWPPVERFLRGAVIPLLVIAIGISQAINFGLLDDQLLQWIGSDADQLPILQATFTPICLGVVLAHALHSPRRFAQLAQVFGRHGSAPICALLVLGAINWPVEDISGLPRLAMQIGFTALLACMVILEDHPLRKLMQLSLMRKIGAVSYGMYLFHTFVIVGIEKFEHRLPFSSPVLLFLIATAGTTFLAEMSFRYFENPILRLKKRFSV